jgi:hypothetical protein
MKIGKFAERGPFGSGYRTEQASGFAKDPLV